MSLVQHKVYTVENHGITKQTLTRCTLAEAGIKAEGVAAFLHEAEKKGFHLHTFMLTRHGQVAFECSWAPYRLEERHLIHSFTKGLVAAAIGILEGEHRLNLDDTLISYFPEYPRHLLASGLEKLTIRHVLTMTGGHGQVFDRHGCDDEILSYFQNPILHEPGTCFLYDSMGTTMLSSLVKRITGFGLFQFLQLRIFEPLGITGAICDTCASGRDQGGGGARMKTEDMAKITLLYLNEGKWNGQQLIPADWIRRMTSVQFRNSFDGGHPHWKDWQCGYGFQVWMCRIPNTFRFDGMFGQFGVVLKDYDASIVTTCGEWNTQGLLELMWKHLIPSFRKEPLLSEQDALERELDIRKKTFRIDWDLEHQVSPEKSRTLWKQLEGCPLLFSENRESLLPEGRVDNCFTSSWTEKQRRGIRSFQFRREESRFVLDYVDNGISGSLPVGMEGSPARGLLKSLWGDYVVWLGGRWLSDGSLELQIRMAEGEYYQVFRIHPGTEEREISLYSGPQYGETGVSAVKTCRCVRAQLS